MSLALGEKAPGFALTGVDGKTHRLDDYADAEALVLIQSCNHCPYVLAWEGRMVAVQEAYARRGVRVVAVNSNDASRYPEDSFARMTDHAAEKGFNFDYLHDPEQTLARALGSARTPEVFLFDKERRLVYHGLIDDSRDETAVSVHYLRDALEALLAGGSPGVVETTAVGCSVKWRNA